jgi:PAS domain S-box-containing protein
MTRALDHAPRAEVLPLRAPWSALPPLASALSILVGLLVLAGWGLDVEILKRLRPGFVAMNPMTAVLFVLAGAALGCSIKRNRPVAFRWSARIGAILVLTIAGAKLIGLGLNWPSNVDQWLFAEKLSGHGGEVPNRIAPNTAANFVLIALSLLFLDRPVKRFSPSQFFALLAGLGALLPITGYAYGVGSFTGLASFIPMALHTAITCLVLAMGLFFAREATPLSQLFATDDSRGVIARRLFPLIILLTLFLGWLRLEGERRGLYEAAFGTALFVVVLCVLFVAVILWTVFAVAKVEEERNSLNDALLESRWQLEESLRQSQLIVDHARELICTLDAQARLLTVNAACDEILALPSRQLLGRSFLEIHSPEEQSRIEKVLAVAKTGMTPEPFSAQCRKGDTTYARLDWSIQWSPHYEKMFCVGRPG